MIQTKVKQKKKNVQTKENEENNQYKITRVNVKQFIKSTKEQTSI